MCEADKRGPKACAVKGRLTFLVPLNDYYGRPERVPHLCKSVHGADAECGRSGRTDG